MKRNVSISTSLLIITLSVVTTVAGKASFAGTWVMDKSRSEGMSPGEEQTMTITQTDDTLNVETRIVIAPQGEEIIYDCYLLNGNEVEFKPHRGVRIEGQGKRTAKWSSDGNAFEVNEEEEYISGRRRCFSVHP